MSKIIFQQDEDWDSVPIGDIISGEGAEIETDNVGQIVIYTGLFRWHDGTIRDSVEPRAEEDNTARLNAIAREEDERAPFPGDSDEEPSPESVPLPKTGIFSE